MKLIVIAAVASNNVIGDSGKLPWYISDDLKRFKALTLGNTVIMGRTTYESIVRRIGKPLPERKNIVLSRNPDFKAAEGVIICKDINEAVEKTKGDNNIFVIFL